MSRIEVSEKRSRDYVAISVWQIIEDEGGIRREDFNDDSRFIEDMELDYIYEQNHFIKQKFNRQTVSFRICRNDCFTDNISQSSS
jgi:hypothetical protein